MMKYLFCIITGFAGGLVVGTGVVAFFTILGIVTRSIEISNSSKCVKWYEFTILLGAIISALFYFFDIELNWTKYVFPPVIGLFMGIFVGMVASALAEMLDVMPVMADRMSMRKFLYIGIFAIIFGKTLGSIIYWTVSGLY